MSSNSNSIVDTAVAIVVLVGFVVMIPSLLFGVIVFELVKAVADINILKWFIGGVATGAAYYFWEEVYKPFMYKNGVNNFFSYVIMYAISIGGFYVLVEVLESKNPVAHIVVVLWKFFIKWAMGS